MKIGILTHPLETNYGGNLQAFALQKALRNLGFDAITIDRHSEEKYGSFKEHFIDFCKRIIKRIILRQNVSLYWNPFISKKDSLYISRNVQSFIDKNILLTRRIDSLNLSTIDKEYCFDAYVVGSDQVWLARYCPNSFLDFVARDNVTKIFYAASTGATSFVSNPVILKKCQLLVRDFKAVSVRESSLVDIAAKYLNVDAKWVLDPTLLLEVKDYLSLISPQKYSSKFLFTYILDRSNRKNQIVDFLAKNKHLTVRCGNAKKNYVKKLNLNLDDCVFPSVENWIDGFYQADFVVTDSFHGTIFSILFNKQFVVVGNPNRGLERFKSILDLFGLSSRLIFSLEDVKTLTSETIDFTEVNIKLEKLRRESLNFLKTNLGQI